MTVTDTFLQQIASALASETYIVPSYLTVGTTVIIPGTTDTDLTGEIGPREVLTTARVDNQVEFSTLRSSTSVIQATGDTLNSTALFGAATSGDMFTSVSLPQINHTNSYDIEFDWTITINRRA